MTPRRQKEEVVLTSDEVGRQLGITGSAVRQIEKRAIAKLRKRLLHLTDDLNTPQRKRSK